MAGGNNIFLSYRRDDSAGYTGRLHDYLSAQLNTEQLFWDIDSVAPGEDFVDTIDQTLAQSVVVIVVIGPRWLSVGGSDGTRRLDSDNDFHRLEIQRAIEHKLKIIPVLVGGAKMPGEGDLPRSIRSLARKNAFELSDKRFKQDAEKFAAIVAEEVRRSASTAMTPLESSKPTEAGAISKSNDPRSTGALSAAETNRPVRADATTPPPPTPRAIPAALKASAGGIAEAGRSTEIRHSSQSFEYPTDGNPSLKGAVRLASIPFRSSTPHVPDRTRVANERAATRILGTYAGTCENCSTHFSVTLWPRVETAKCPECFRITDVSSFKRSEITI